MLVFTQYCDTKHFSCLWMSKVTWYIGIFAIFIFKELDSSTFSVLQALSWLHKYCCFSRCQKVCACQVPYGDSQKRLSTPYNIAFPEFQVSEDQAKLNPVADLIMIFFFLIIEPKEVATHVLIPVFPFQSSTASEGVKSMASFGLWN